MAEDIKEVQEVQEVQTEQANQTVETQSQPQQQLPQIDFVGGYAITGKGKLEHSLIFKFVKKPNRIHRFFCKLLLGWIWVDNQNEIK